LPAPNPEGAGGVAVRGPEGHDPRALNYGGELKIASRGLFKFFAVLSLVGALLCEPLGTAAARDQAQKAAQADIDQIIRSQTNQPEYKRPQNNEFREAGRFVPKHNRTPA